MPIFREAYLKLGDRQLAAVRIWSLHPKYLDARGLVALWREGLLAQAVLEGEDEGVHTPSSTSSIQSSRFPLGSIAGYLRFIHEEATSRGYRFAAKKIARSEAPVPLTVTRGQIEFEWRHLMEKLRVRDPKRQLG